MRRTLDSEKNGIERAARNIRHLKYAADKKEEKMTSTPKKNKKGDNTIAHLLLHIKKKNYNYAADNETQRREAEEKVGAGIGFIFLASKTQRDWAKRC